MHINLNNISMEFTVSDGKKRALDNVSLFVAKGERLGVIGRNGAGKTTLLQIMAGLLQPTGGQLDVSGRVNCVMTLGVGLREEMTGRENIYVDGELNTKSRDEIDALQDEIIAFADIGDFIDLPVRTYSTGMKARLAFALVTFIDPEILIIDEALSAGDAVFSVKATQKIRELCDRGKIVIIVSHSMQTIRDMCTRCIWMENGRLAMDGACNEVTESYWESVRRKDEEEMRVRFQRRVGPRSFQTGCSIERMDFVDSTDKSRLVWRSDEEVMIRFVINADLPISQPDLKMSFEKLDGNIILANSASEDGYKIDTLNGRAVFEVDFGKLQFGEDTYEVQVELWGQVLKEAKRLLACYCEIIKVEKPLECLDSPAYFCPIEIRAQKLSDTPGDL